MPTRAARFESSVHVFKDALVEKSDLANETLRFDYAHPRLPPCCARAAAGKHTTSARSGGRRLKSAKARIKSDIARGSSKDRV